MDRFYNYSFTAYRITDTIKPVWADVAEIFAKIDYPMYLAENSDLSVVIDTSENLETHDGINKVLFGNYLTGYLCTQEKYIESLYAEWLKARNGSISIYKCTIDEMIYDDSAHTYREISIAGNRLHIFPYQQEDPMKKFWLFQLARHVNVSRFIHGKEKKIAE